MNGRLIEQLRLAYALFGGAKRVRTADLCSAIAALYQLSYSPRPKIFANLSYLSKLLGLCYWFPKAPMQPKRDLAITLRSVPFEDRHRVVTALTENHGVVSALARNCVQSRRFGGTLDAFAASEWLFVEKPGAELWRLDEARIRRSFEGLRSHFERLSLAAVFNELILKLAPKHEACPELFRLHSNALAVLEEAPSNPPPNETGLLNIYLAKLLQWSGSQPRLLSCLGCETPLERVPNDETLRCKVEEAGWLCLNCQHSDSVHRKGRAHHSGLAQSSLQVPPLGILDFHVALSFPVKQAWSALQASTEDHRKLFRYLEALMIYHLPGLDREPLKGLRFLNLTSSWQSIEGHPESTSPHP